MRPSISIALAAYNGEKYLKTQLDSILPQLEDSDEIVISLDPSSDGTAALVESYGDTRIRLIEGPGKGVISNFENALSETQNDIIFLCDQDDYWAENKVQRVLEIFAETDCTLVLHDAKIVDGDMREQAPSFFALRGTRTGLLHNVLKNSYIGCCMAMRRSLLERALPFPANLPMHDQWIGLLAEKHGGVVLLPEPLLYYRRHGDNVSSDTHASFVQMIKWRLAILHALRKNG